MQGTGYQRICCHIFPRDVLPWRSIACVSSVYQALSPFVGPGPGNEATAACTLGDRELEHFQHGIRKLTPTYFV